MNAVMQPFVRSAGDLRVVRQTMAENGLADAELFAKVENQPGLDALPDWLALCDVVTIARGDLGSSLPLERLPAAQKRIAALCRSRFIRQTSGAICRIRCGRRSRSVSRMR